MKALTKRKYEGCRNMLHPELQDEIIERLEAFFDNPCDETWEDAHCIIVGADGFTTFWQAVIAVNPTFPRIGPRHDMAGRIETWKEVPDYFTARRAIQYAKTLNQRKELKP